MFCCVFFFCFVSFYPFSLQSIRRISNCLVPNCVFHNPVGLGWFDPAALGPGLWLLSQGGLGLFFRVRMMEDWGGPWWLGGSTGSSLVCLHLWVLVCVESLVPFGQGLRFPWARGLPAFGGGQDLYLVMRGGLFWCLVSPFFSCTCTYSTGNNSRVHFWPNCTDSGCFSLV